MKSESIKNSSARKDTTFLTKRIKNSHEKNARWLKVIKVRKNQEKSDKLEIEKSTGKRRSNERAENKIEQKKALKDENKILREEENRVNEPLSYQVILPDIKKAELHTIAKRMVSAIYINFNEYQRKELILSFLPAVFKDTTVRVEKISGGRIRIIVNASSISVRNFFSRIRENISAGLSIKGIIIDEFKI